MEGRKRNVELKDMLIEMRTSTGMNRREFAEYFEIPYRTMQDWELGNRKMPEYLYRLMEYKVRIEKLYKEKEEEKRAFWKGGEGRMVFFGSGCCGDIDRTEKSKRSK